MSNFVIPYTLPGNYTISDVDKLEVVGGLLRTKEITHWSNLTAYWQMNEAAWNGTPDEVVDTSGNAKHLTGSGGVTTIAGGKLGRAGDFDGVGDTLVRPGIIINPAADFSLSIWVYVTDTVNFQSVFSQYDFNGAGHPAPAIEITSGLIRFRFVNAADITFIVSTAVTTGWHHIVVTKSNTTLEMYYDGVSQGTITFSGSPRTVTELRVGARYYGTEDSYFKGRLDELATWDIALDPADITYLYNAGVGKVIHKYSTDTPSAYKTLGDTDALLQTFTNFVETVDGSNQGLFGYQLSDDGINWKYYSGGWVPAGASNYNSSSVVNTNLSSFPAANKSIYVKVFVISDGMQLCALNENQVGYSIFQAPLIDAGTNKTAGLTGIIDPFSDCTFSDPDGTVDHAYYKVDGEVDVWTEIPISGYGTLLEAVQAFLYQFLDLGVKTVRLQVEDNDGATSEDSLTVTVSHDIIPPAKATGVVASDLGTDGDVKLTWNRSPDDGIGNNDVQYYGVAVSDISAVDATNKTNARDFLLLFVATGSIIYERVVGGLINETQYWFIVSPVDDVGNYNADFTAGDAVTAIPTKEDDMSTVTAGVFTRVYNQTGVARYFGSLPPHGREIEAGEFVDIPGILENEIKNSRALKSFQSALIAGELYTEVYNLDGTSSSSA